MRRVALTDSINIDVVVIHTDSDDVVYLTPRDALADLLKDDSPFRLTMLGERILQRIPNAVAVADAKGIVVPMVDLKETIQLRWMLDMTACATRGDVFTITQALQQTKFSLDEIGAKVESAAEMVGETSVDPRQPFVIDKPFLAIVARKNTSLPILVADVGPEFWKRPSRQQAAP